MSSKENEIGFLLNRATRLARAALDEQLAAVGVSPVEWAILRHIDLAENEGTSRSVDELARAFGEDRARVSQAVRSLAARHLVTSHRDLAVRLTSEGQRLVRPLADMATFAITAATSGFTAEETDLLVQYLRRMNENLEGAAQNGRPSGAPRPAEQAHPADNTPHER